MSFKSDSLTGLSPGLQSTAPPVWGGSSSGCAASPWILFGGRDFLKSLWQTLHLFVLPFHPSTSVFLFTSPTLAYFFLVFSQIQKMQVQNCQGCTSAPTTQCSVHASLQGRITKTTQARRGRDNMRPHTAPTPSCSAVLNFFQLTFLLTS